MSAGRISCNRRRMRPNTVAEEEIVMPGNARDEILKKLKAAPRTEVQPRPNPPALAERSLDREQMIQKFTAELNAQTGVVHRAKTSGEALRILTEVASAEKLQSVMLSTDVCLAALDLGRWGEKAGIQVFTAGDFPDRESYRDAVFEVDAGITGADFAIAETGTLGLIFNANQSRLISIAPPLHIALVPLDRLLPIYEDAVDKVFADKEHLPSQFCFITGPSASADIQATAFKGMHGPKKVIVILLES